MNTEQRTLHMYASLPGMLVKDTNGVEWRVDTIIEGAAARAAQIYPGFCQVNISPPGSATRNHTGIQMREGLALDWIQGGIRMVVSEAEIAGNGEYHSKGQGEISRENGSQEVENREFS